MNSAINLSTRELVNVKFFVSVIMNYCGGCAIFKYLDLVLKGSGSRCAAAPLVLALQVTNDKLRMTFPESRYHMLLLAMSNGIFNTLSAEKFGCLTHVITGHYQKVSTDLVTMSMKG